MALEVRLEGSDEQQAVPIQSGCLGKIAVLEQRTIMEQPLQQTVALLGRTPASLNAFLRELPDSLTRQNEGGDTWCAYDIVGHLVYAERTDWLPRVKMILEFGETRAFEKFDRLGQVRESQGKSLGQLLDEFSSVRSKNLVELRALNLQQEDLDKRGLHPALGIVTLSQLIATWAAHDLTHLHQLSRIMAYQYREAVGPWNVYLGVMKCTGHSSS